MHHYIVTMKSVLILAVLCSAAAAEFVSYDGYKTYELHPTDEQQIDVIASFASNEHFDFWTYPIPKIVGLPTTVMVDSEAQSGFLQTLDDANIPYNVLIENVESVMQAERTRQTASQRLAAGRIGFTEYHRFVDIDEYLVQLAENHPDIVHMEIVQASAEGRPLRMLRIGTGGSDRPVILIEGGIHAREWIASALCLYIIQELVENENNRDLIENVDWYIIPLINPDGYEYTHTTDRLWRKTRSVNWNSDCIGTDGNRNFDYEWASIYKDDDPCSSTFSGYAPFDQFETIGLRNVVENYQIFGNQIKLFLSMHNYGHYILYPWAHTRDLPEDAEELQALGSQVQAAILAVNGTWYGVGGTAYLLYYASGLSSDWVKAVGGVDLSYTIELPGGGSAGFDLPASRILGVCLETFEGIRVFHKYIEEKFVNQISFK